MQLFHSYLILLYLGVFSCTIAQTCEDSSTFTFSAWKKSGRTCAWLSSGTNAVVQRKKDVLCPQVKSSRYVKDKCPKTCENCPEGPSVSPSPSKTPSVSHPPSQSPSISNSPTLKLSNCIEDEAFSKYGKTCNQIRNSESNRSFFCQNADVRASCPVTCGLCCADNSAYTFGRSNKRTCDWIALENSRISNLCVSSIYRKNKKVVYMCSKTCNTCEDKVNIS